MENKILRFCPSPLIRFEVQLTEHCNLNCRNCMHYAPLAKPEFLNVDLYEKDLNRLSELFSGEAEWIRLMGGEPLLHPEINYIIRITRKNFPYGKIRIVSNGILIPLMKDEFWNECKHNNIEICMTKYPIEIDYFELIDKIEHHGVTASMYSGSDRSPTMWRFPIDTMGDFDPVFNFYHCEKANVCLTLKQGRLFPCATSAHAHHLINFFHLPICSSKRNGVDIYSVRDAEELMQKVATPKPFCRYCDYSNVSDYEDDWSVSNRFLYDWVSFTFSNTDMEFLSNASDIYIYGAGNWGKRVLKRIRDAGIPVKNVLVSKTSDNPSMFGNIKVIEITSIEEVDEEAICIIAVEGKEKKEIQHKLVEHGFKKIIPLFQMK